MATAPKPNVDDAPGLVWKATKTYWIARWQARTDLVEKGFYPKTVRLWTGTEMTEAEAAHISDQCRQLQAEMLVFGRGGIPQMPMAFDGTLRTLVGCYQTDPDSPYKQLRYKTRINYDHMIARLLGEHGDERLADIKARTLLRWHEAWSAGGKVAIGHCMIGMLRTLFSFGNKFLEDPECKRMKDVLHDMRFKVAPPRQHHVTADQAEALRRVAHRCGYRSIALAQAFQFELMLRQKDVIGEYVPQSEPGLSDVLVGKNKWITGIRWEEVDQNLILRHVTSKRQKPIEVDLKVPPMLVEELRYVAQTTAWARHGAKAIMAGVPEPDLLDTVTRADLPASGPIVTSEITALPWVDHDFRRVWRKMARMAGIPDHVRNMDSRAGGITEATSLGIDLEDVRHAATHSQISMTARYSRGSTDKVAKVLQLRAAGRKAASNGTDTE